MIVEEVLLPSMGKPYGLDYSPKVKLRPFTTKEYKDIIVSGTDSSVDNLLKECLVDCVVKVDSFVYEDKLALLLKLRSITLGPKMTSLNYCPSCKRKETVEWNIDELEVNYLDVDEYPIPVVLPESNAEVKLRLLSPRMEDKVKELARNRAAKYSISESSLYSSLLLASQVDANKGDSISTDEWINSLPIRDVMYLESALSSIHEFGVVIYKVHTCSFCNKDFRAMFNTSEGLFRIEAQKPRGFKTRKGILSVGTQTTDVIS